MGDLVPQTSAERTKVHLKLHPAPGSRNLLLANPDYICYAANKELKIFPKN